MVSLFGTRVLSLVGIQCATGSFLSDMYRLLCPARPPHEGVPNYMLVADSLSGCGPDERCGRACCDVLSQLLMELILPCRAYVHNP
jgi:hypothetical protein